MELTEHKTLSKTCQNEDIFRILQFPQIQINIKI